MLIESKSIDIAVDGEKLTKREQILVATYCSNGFNMTDAVRTAGYKIPVDSNGRYKISSLSKRIFRKPKIQKAIKNFLDNTIKIAKERLEFQLIKYYNIRAFYNPSDIIGDNGELKIPLSELGDLGICVEGIVTRYHGKDANIKVRTVKLADREKAMAQLSKYIKIISDNHQHLHLGNGVDGGIPVAGKRYKNVKDIDEEIKKIDMQLQLED